MSDYILGINCFGDSIIVSEIPIGSDLMRFNYICSVSLKTNDNDNKVYDVFIVNKDNVSGMPVGKWKIKNAEITEFWGVSYSCLVMEDEQGVETSSIKACKVDVGTKTREKVSISFLTRAIFTKAQEIVRDYPNAEILNAIIELEKFSDSNNLSHIKYLYEESKDKSNENYLDFIEEIAKEIIKHIEVLKNSTRVLKELDDKKYEKIRNDIITKCKIMIDNLRTIL
mgnify:CR=1 FL=1